MHSQDGDVVVHEAQHELRHQTRIPELEQCIAKAKGKAKKGGEGKLSSQSTRMPPPMPPSSIAPTPSNKTGPRRFSVHDLGSVSIPHGLLTQEDLQVVLQQTTRALQALTYIVQDLSRSVAGQGYQSWSSLLTSIQRRFTEEVSLKKVLKKKQSRLEERKIGLFAEGIDMESFH
ncbi:hypothetical protein Bca4012_031161 [Brassica carinata]